MIKKQLCSTVAVVVLTAAAVAAGTTASDFTAEQKLSFTAAAAAPAAVLGLVLKFVFLPSSSVLLFVISPTLGCTGVVPHEAMAVEKQLVVGEAADPAERRKEVLPPRFAATICSALQNATTDLHFNVTF